MAEPLRNLDEDQPEDQLASARDRADQAWGMSEPEASVTQSEEAEPRPALARANESWGMASAIQGGANDGDDRERLKKGETSGGNVGPSNADERSQVSSASGVDVNSMNYSGSDGSGGQGGQEGTIAKKSRGTRLLNFLTKRSSVAGIFGGGAVGVLLIAGFTAAQPFQIVHFSQLLQQFHFLGGDESDTGRVSKLINYARTIDSPERRNLGWAGNKIADRYEGKLKAAGFEPNFKTTNGGNSRYMTGYSVDPDTPAGKSALDKLQAKGVDIDSLEREGKMIKINLEGRGGSTEGRRAIKASVDAIGENRISSALSKRLLIKRAGVGFHPLKNLKRKVGISVTDYTASVREKIKERRANGSAPNVEKLTADGETDADGNKVEPTSDGTVAATEGNAATEIAQSAEPKPTKLSGVQEKLGKGAAVIGVMCAVKAIGDQVDEAKYVKTVIPLMRVGVDIVSTGSQVMYSFSQDNSDVNLDELGVVTKDLYDVSKKMGWSSARSIQAELGQPQTGPDTPATAVPGKIGEKNIVFEAIDKVFSSSFGAAGAVCSKLGQTLMGAITPIQTLFTEGGLALSRAAFGTDPVQALAGWAVDLLSGDNVDVSAKGPDLGSIANLGTLYAANDIEIAKGGGEMQPKQAMELRRDRNADAVAQVRAKSLFARLFDLKEPRSVASVAFLQSGNLSSPQSFVASLTTTPLSIFTGSAQNIARIATPRVFAQESSEPYDYGIPEFGFTKEELNDPRFEDPYANAAIVEPQLGALNDKYGGCFSMKVNTETGALETSELAKYEGIVDNKSCSDGTEALLRYRFYIKDTVNKKALLCRSGIDEDSCEELGFNSGGEDSTPTPGTLPSGTAQELAKRIVESGKVTGDSRYMQQIQAVADGNGDCHVNPTILGLIASLSSKFEIYITSLNRRCTGVLTASGEASYHYADGGGHAVDIGIVDGVKSTGATPKDLALINEALGVLPSGSGIGQSECRSTPLTLPEGITQFKDDCNHIHIQVPKQ